MKILATKKGKKKLAYLERLGFEPEEGVQILARQKEIKKQGLLYQLEKKEKKLQKRLEKSKKKFKKLKVPSKRKLPRFLKEKTQPFF